MLRQTLVIIALLLGTLLTIQAGELDGFKDYYKDKGPKWILTPGINGGINKVGKGYTGYEDLGHGGFDLYLRPPPPAIGKVKWYQRMMLRFSGDYFPLQVPEGVYGLTHDIYSANFSLIYKFTDMQGSERRKLIPFFGAGAGAYREIIELNSPASGKVSGGTTYIGINASAGFFLPGIGRLRLVPEVRHHALKLPGNFWATNTTFQLGIVLWKDPKVNE